MPISLSPVSTYISPIVVKAPKRNGFSAFSSYSASPLKFLRVSSAAFFWSCELSIEEIAHYTGRSLATFKRDFKKISDLTPEKWLIKKRLEKAYELMKAGRKKVVEVYAEVGFRNPSHFSTAFKKEFGVAPTALLN